MLPFLRSPHVLKQSRTLPTVGMSLSEVRRNSRLLGIQR